jgi:hypothetical protein
MEQGPLSNEESSHIAKHPVAKCVGFENCRFLGDFLLLLTLLSLNIEFNTVNRTVFQLEPSLGPPNKNQDRLCSTAKFVTKQIISKNTARTNSCLHFPKVLENTRPGVFNTLSVVTDCKIKAAREKQFISVANILRTVYEFGKQHINLKKGSMGQGLSSLGESAVSSSMVIYVSLTAKRFKIGCTCCEKNCPFAS